MKFLDQPALDMAADDPSGRMGVETQRGGVFDEQILTRDLAGLDDPLSVRGNNRVMGDIGLGEQTIGGPQIFPIGKGSGQGAVGILG